MTNHHRSPLKSALLTTGAFLLLGAHLTSALLNAKQPNIVFLMADDLGWADVGYNGAEFYETPNIDALCRSGMRFDSGYPGASNCMPSRACIMSGTYITRTQMWTPGGKAKGEFEYMKFLVPNRSNSKGDTQFASSLSLAPSVISLAETLKHSGYKTAHFCKWHLGPDGQGFDINDTNGKGAGLDKKFYGNPNVAEWLTDAAVEFIGNNRDNPFFIYLCHWDVHTPRRARAEVVEKYRAKLATGNWPKNWNPTYAAMIEAVDISVGRVKQALKANGVDDNTLFVFTSDNGGPSGSTWCEPLKGAKGAFYEGGIRVPLCMTWPNVIAPGTVCKTPVTGVDYLPSFAELAEAPLTENQPVDGRSFIPLLFQKTLSERAIFWHYPLYLKGATYNQVVPIAETDRPHWRATPCSVIRQGNWKLIQFFETNSVELYNLTEDLGEHHDLAKQFPEKTNELLTTLQAWQTRTHAVIPTELNPEFAPPNNTPSDL